MSEFKKWLSPKDQILYALYKQKPRVGYGFNELRDACGGLHGRYIDIFTNPKKGKLVKDGFIVIKKVMGKGGIKELRMITEKGVEYVQKNIVGVETAVRNVLRLTQALTEKERFDALGQVFKDMYEYASSLFMAGKRLNMMDVLFDALNMAIMDDVNASWLIKKDDMVKRSVFSGNYVFPDFTRKSYPLDFIKRDADLALDVGHYLNTHHRYVLEKLGSYSKEDIEKKNVEWLEKHKKYDPEVVKSELKDRMENWEKYVESLRTHQKIMKIEMYGKEYSIKNPPETYEQTPNWMQQKRMRQILGNYGESLWDIR
jgi:hypothetical protein